MKKVENLTKVTLRLEAGTTADHMDLTPAGLEFKFIFGIGPSGMCPFEYELINKNEDELFLMRLNKEEIHHFLGHLHLSLIDLFEENRSFFLKVKILKIDQPSSKEVVKALAEMASHPGDCDCGCGC